MDLGKADIRHPVLILGFNRPELFRNALAKTLEAGSRRIYIALDGPRRGNALDKVQTQEVQTIAQEFAESNQVRLLVRKENLGCKQAVSEGISWFFRNEEAGIILEDDISPSSSFFTFCDLMLAQYANDKRVFSIAGYRAKKDVQANGEIIFSKYPQVWGWATWRRAWLGYDAELSSWRSGGGSLSRNIHPKLNPLARKYWTDIFDSCKAGEIDTWDYQLTYLSLAKDGLTAIPPVNLVKNIGFGKEATHTTQPSPRHINTKYGSLGRSPSPGKISADHSYDFWLELYSFRVWRRVLSIAVRAVLGR